MFVIEVDEEECIGCGTCVAVCSDNWEMIEDKAFPKKTEIERIGCNQEAIDSCPVACIKIKKLKG